MISRPRPLPVLIFAALCSGTPIAVTAQETAPSLQGNPSDGLSLSQRDSLQRALSRAGITDGTVGGTSPGDTRDAAQRGQAQPNEPVTGALTPEQRDDLMGDVKALRAEVGMKSLTDERAGITIDMPLGLVSFSGYEPPFAQYAARQTDGTRVSLISEPGDATMLQGLFAVLQSFSTLPPATTKDLAADGFTLEGADDQQWYRAYARLAGNSIKGFLIVTPVAEGPRGARIASQMQQSFRPVEGVVMDFESGGPDAPAQPITIATHLPQRTATGLYVDRQGYVLTAAGSVENCARVTLADNDALTAEVVASDEELGVALLRPDYVLNPRQVARFSDESPAERTRVAIAGFPYGGRLNAPVLTYGAVRVSEGSAYQLGVAAKSGDSGAPVLDAAGRVSGMLLPSAPGDQSGLRLSSDPRSLLRFLESAGRLPARATPAAAPLDPVDLSAMATDLTVLVSCWR
jgi:hypothetical protein